MNLEKFLSSLRTPAYIQKPLHDDFMIIFGKGVAEIQKSDLKSANFTTDNAPQANTSNINLKKSSCS